jgi:NodT family efflux transporter outer membrane factor (OMF) lipoprotein
MTAAGSLASARSLSAPSTPWPREAWWTVYGDKQLDALQNEALFNSPTLQAADARLRKAQAIAQQAGASLLPELSGDASIGGVRQTLNQGFPKDAQSLLPQGFNGQARVVANLSYQLDLFGKNRTALAAATSDADAAAADRAEAYLQLSTAIATAYADLARLFAQRDVATDAIKIQKNTLSVVADRRSSGLANDAEYSQQAALVPAAEADLEAVDRQIELRRHQIAALVGDGPDRGFSISRPRAALLKAMGVPKNLGLDLAGRRPDLVAARLRAEAAAKRVKVAQLDYYPNIDLNAYAGVQSIPISELFTHKSVIAAVGPAIHLPIFAGGRLEGAFRGARADYDEAVAHYNGVLTDALRDIADVLSSRRSVRRQLAKAEASLAAATDAYEAQRTRYSAGLNGLIDVLTAQNTLIAQRRMVADLKAQSLSLDIALVRALGGGFSADTRVAAQ